MQVCNNVASGEREGGEREGGTIPLRATSERAAFDWVADRTARGLFCAPAVPPARRLPLASK